MKQNKLILPILAFLLLVTGSACDRTSSPEGRMSIKLEELQQEMRDSLKKQNEAIRDSLGNIREAIQRLEQERK